MHKKEERCPFFMSLGHTLMLKYQEKFNDIKIKVKFVDIMC